ncbi:hypothetical protein [Arthrobacter sp. efr-133-TYG-118]|uniref:hypothetical protein n=1 Tax=Arthrobacter sp. efr-133-TYG-118 TaxID=3040279 RepID=UPI0025507E3F|nr:hypothetical protein [Arthrobacter sp. efr-133-TYG-118]
MTLLEEEIAVITGGAQHLGPALHDGGGKMVIGDCGEDAMPAGGQIGREGIAIGVRCDCVNRVGFEVLR